MIKKLVIDEHSLTPEQIFSYKAQYEVGTAHMKYWHDTMKHFKFPERRVKTFDTVQYENNLPEIERALRSLGVLKNK